MWRAAAAPLALVSVSLLDRATVVGGQDGPVTAVGSPARWGASEPDRLEVWRRVHGGLWPPPKLYPGGVPQQESEGWVKGMEEYEKSARAASGALRWERWLDLGQMRMVKNFTERGWAVVDLDPAVHADMARTFANRSPATTVDEGTNEGLQRYIEGDRDVWDIQKNLPDELRNRMKDAIRNSLSAWVGIPAEKLSWTAAYGIRIYRNNSVLLPHVDHLRTHVLSAVYCVAIEGEEAGQEPWYLGAYPDFTGATARVDLRPGQLFLYESAKLPHGRPGTFRGLGYAAIFTHFQPEGWDLTAYDRIYVLPEGWDRSVRAEL